MKVAIILSIFLIFQVNLIHALIEESLFSYCNPISTIKLNDELQTPPENFELKKLFIVVRHGDRGPHRPLRHLDQLNCDIRNSENNDDMKLYEEFLSDMRKDNYSIRTDSHCHVDLLTNVGFLQHLKLGQLIGKNYIPKLNLSHSSIDPIKAYSTEISRTKESATAFLYYILKTLGKNYSKEYAKIITTDSQTLFCIRPEFCDRNCTEKNSVKNSTEKLDNSVIAQAIKYTQDLAPFLANNKSDLHLFQSPGEVGDGLLTFYCHNHTIPCIEDINKKCINTENITQFLSFINGLTLKTSVWNTTKNINLLLIHGFLNNLFMSIDSNETEKFTLFSGHDDSISALAIALNFFDSFPSFASRIIFESYRDKNTNKKYLRIIYNGKDEAHSLELCKMSPIDCLNLSANIKLIDSHKLKMFVKQKFESVFMCN